MYSLLTILYKGVELQATNEMSDFASGRECESSGVTGINVLDGSADCDAQASSSTQSQAQPPKDGSFKSGGRTLLLS